jgi:hypothetical protein
MSWAGISSNQTVSCNNLQDAVTNGIFYLKATIPSSLKQITKAEAESYVYINSVSGKTSGQLVVKSNLVASTFTIGQSALGGIIAYILQSGDPGYSSTVQHGLVATVADLSASAEWGCQGTAITGADATAIGTGNQNTIDIMAGCSTAGIAARLCGNLTQGGYSDWYLPSKDELNKLYINQTAIGGFASYPINTYWSSSEDANTYGWNQEFTAGGQNSSLKSFLLNVRAIRAF